MTIHKSQGMTLDLMECNVAECFAPGQTYVALSRAKSIDGLALTEPMEPQHVMADHVLVKYCGELGI
jgi:ATP-dependent exoDNAse (exonuclease V) alpha subunit